MYKREMGRAHSPQEVNREGVWEVPRGPQPNEFSNPKVVMGFAWLIFFPRILRMPIWQVVGSPWPTIIVGGGVVDTLLNPSTLPPAALFPSASSRRHPMRCTTRRGSWPPSRGWTRPGAPLSPGRARPHRLGTGMGVVYILASITWSDPPGSQQFRHPFHAI